MAEVLPGRILRDESGHYRKSVEAIVERNNGEDGRRVADRCVEEEERDPGQLHHRGLLQSGLAHVGLPGKGRPRFQNFHGERAAGV